jgi:translation initiation factor IF-1
MQRPTGSTASHEQTEPIWATVVAVLPNASFRLRLQDGSEVQGHAGADMRMRISRLVPGDQVPVERAAFDPLRVRISGPPQHRRGQP